MSYEDNNFDINVEQGIGFRDKYDGGSGLAETDPKTVDITTMEYSLTVDSRDCVGITSLSDAQTYALFNGLRDGVDGSVISCTGNGVPIVLTLNNVLGLKNNDTIIVTNVRGNTRANGTYTITNVTVTVSPVGTVQLQGPLGNGDYTGGGYWDRDPDSGYPTLNTNNTSVIKGNEIIVALQRSLRNLRTLSLHHIIIPRDIIPMSVYLSDFITVCTSNYSLSRNTTYISTETNYTSYIPQETVMVKDRLLGFYSSPLDLWRSYINGAVSMPNTSTPPPLLLWNPPKGAWPTGQPNSYPFQVVPTYKSNEFIISGQTGTFYIILSGYGVYDLLDWTINTGSPDNDRAQTIIMRKLLLILIAQKQSYREINYVDLIMASNVIDVSNNVYPFGYGDFQRFVPGPGIGMNYQPGTNSIIPGDPTVASTDSPITFPNFRGNVFGPYNYPSARFQKLGVTDTIQDLYLNGDLSNLYGESIILPNVPVEAYPTHPSYGLNFLSQIEVNLSNFTTTTNPNILNAMRIEPNGFGASVVRANGQGNPLYVNAYGELSGLGAGGIGPSSLGVPSAWVNHGVYSSGGDINDPIPQGPIGPNPTVNSVSPSTNPTHNTAFVDKGQGVFLGNITKYINYAVNEIPDTDLIIKINEAERTIRSLSTNSNNSYCLLDCPIRLSLGSFNGTQQYVENNSGMVAGAGYYWEQRYVGVLSKLDRLHIKFFTHDGTEIELEKMLNERRSLSIQRLNVKLMNELNLSTAPIDVSYLFNPLDPKLNARLNRYMQIIFKVQCYENVTPGLIMSTLQAPSDPSNDNPNLNYKFI